MAEAFVGAGSNIDPEVNVAAALRLLAAAVRITAVSTVYRTEAELRPEQSHYYNCVFKVETELSPENLKHRVLRNIEEKLGRHRTADTFAARTIDLDLLLYDDLVVTMPDLVLPDPDILRRPYLAAALKELSPRLIVPGSRTSIDEVLSVTRCGVMTPLKEYTERLRKEIDDGHQQGQD